MPATSPEAIARKAAHKREHRATCEYRAEHPRSSRARNYLQDGAYQDREQIRNAKRHHAEASFRALNLIALDGEADKEANYNLLAAQGAKYHRLFSNTRALHLHDVIPWLRMVKNKENWANKTPDGKKGRSVFTTYSYGYDADRWIGADPYLTQEEKLILTKMRSKSWGRDRTPGWRNEIDLPDLACSVYIGKKIMDVYFWRRDEGGNIVRDDEGRPVYSHEHLKVWDCFSLSGKSFIKTCQSVYKGMSNAEKAEYGPLLELIIKGKGARGQWDGWTQDEIEAYNHAELRWIRYWLCGIRDACLACGLTPHSLSSPAALSRSALTKYGLTRHIQPSNYTTKDWQESGIFHDICSAFYGGRIESAVQGILDALIEFDITSAYPAAMRHLPCLAHGEWRALTKEEIDAANKGQFVDFTCYHLARWRLPDAIPWGPLPVRRRERSIHFPLSGVGGWYWDPEVRATYAAGARPVIVGGWRWESTCEHDRPFAAMLDDLVAMRLRFDAEGNTAAALVIKLAVNSFYGIMAQVAGSARIRDEEGNIESYKVPPTQNMFGAGWITSYTRAQIFQAVTRDPWNVVGVATDAIHCRAKHPFTLDETPSQKTLGTWEKSEHGRVALVKPGVRFYENPGDPSKYRGFQYPIPFSDLEAAWERGDDSLEFVERTYVDVRMAATSPELAPLWGTFQDRKKEHDISPTALRTKRDIFSPPILHDGVRYFMPYVRAAAPSYGYDVLAVPREMTVMELLEAGDATSHWGESVEYQT